MIEILWQQFHFIRPWWLLAFLPMALLVITRFRQETKGSWQDKLPTHLSKALSVGESSWKKQLPLKLLSIIALIVIIIAAGPTWQKQPSPFGEDKAPLMVVLDVSQSMLESDVQPTRLERSKQKILDILSTRKGGTTGLIVFAGSAHLTMPLTEDIDVFAPLLNAISTKIMPRGGKFSEYSLPVIEQEFSQQSHTGTVLLISDGISANTLPAFEEYFSSKPHQLIILAAGNDNKPSDIPLDISGLSSLASAVSGKLITMSVDESDVKDITTSISRHMILNSDSALPWQDMGYGLVFVVAGCFLLWFRKGWLVKWCFALMFIGNLATPSTAFATQWQFADLWLTKDQQGALHFKQQDYLAAAEDFVDPLWKATAYYKAKEYSKAHTYFMREDSLFALVGAANSLAYQREFIAARNLYQEIIDAEPNFPNAQHNLDVLQKLIDEINQMSASQNTENDTSKELGDAPQSSDGAEQLTTSELMIEQTLSAEQILQDENLNEKWMRRVQSDPANFLQSKFQIQLRQQQESKTSSSIKNKAGGQP